MEQQQQPQLVGGPVTAKTVRLLKDKVKAQETLSNHTLQVELLKVKKARLELSVAVKQLIAQNKSKKKKSGKSGKSGKK